MTSTYFILNSFDLFAIILWLGTLIGSCAYLLGYTSANTNLRDEWTRGYQYGYNMAFDSAYFTDQSDESSSSRRSSRLRSSKRKSNMMELEEKELMMS